MTSPFKGKDRLFTVGIVILSVAGVLYFGARAVMDQMDTNQKNPYVYDLSAFEQGSVDSVSYSEVQRLPVQLDKLAGLALDADGFVYVSGDDRILKLDAGGKISDAFPVGETVYCLALDGQNRMYLGMGDHVEVFDRKGKPVSRWESLGQRAMVTSIAVSDSTVYLADAGQLRVWKFATSGTLLGTVGQRDEARGIPGFVIPSPYFDVAVGADGTLWVANTGRHSLENYAHSGDLKTAWGEYATRIEGFCGCCNPSHFAIMNDGAFVTSEKGIPRVKVYSRQGQLAAVVAGPNQFRPGTTGLDLAVDSSGRIYVLDPVQKAVRVFSKTQQISKGEAR